MKKKLESYDVAWFWMILLGAVCVRLYHIGIPIFESVSARQQLTAMLARNYSHLGLSIFYPMVDFPGKRQFYFVEFPIYPYVMSLIHTLTDVSLVMVGRLINVACSLALVCVVYHFAKHIFQSRSRGLCAMSVVAFSPLLITYSRTVQPDMQMFLMSCVAIWMMYRWLEAPSGMNRVAIVVCMAASILLKPQSLFFLMPLFLCVSYQKWGVSLWKQRFFYLCGLFSMLPFVSWMLYARHMQSLYPNDWGHTFSLAFFGFEWLLKAELWLKMIEFGAGKSLTLLGFFGFVYALYHVKEMNPFLKAWLISVVIYMLVFPLHTATHKYYYGPFIVMASFFIAYAWGLVRERVSPKIFWIAFVFTLIFVGACLKSSYRISPRYERSYAATLAAKEMSQPEDLLIVSGRLYYAHRQGWEMRLSSYESVEDMVAYVQDKLDKGVRYFVVSDLDDFQNYPKFKDYIDMHADLVQKEDLYWIYQFK